MELHIAGLNPIPVSIIVEQSYRNCDVTLRLRCKRSSLPLDIVGTMFRTEPAELRREETTWQCFVKSVYPNQMNDYAMIAARLTGAIDNSLCDNAVS